MDTLTIQLFLQGKTLPEEATAAARWIFQGFRIGAESGSLDESVFGFEDDLTAQTAESLRSLPPEAAAAAELVIRSRASS